MQPERLGVIGLGAIGGSLAWRASANGVRVSGYSRQPAESAAAAKVGAVHHVELAPEPLVRSVDLLVLCASPSANLALLERLAEPIRKAGVLVTDVTSVKAPITALADRLHLNDRFVGSHPLTGTHQSGFAAADAAMLDGATVYVTGSAADPAAREVADFWERLCDAEVVHIDPTAHDALVASVSHLPQVASSALAVCLARRGRPGVTYGPGARDTMRLAASETTMWSEVLLANRDQLMPLLDGLVESTRELRSGLERGDADAVHTWLDAGRGFARAVRDA